MLSHHPTLETITKKPPPKWFCGCDPDCLESITIPDDVRKMLMKSEKLMLLIGKHKSPNAGEMVKRDKGWKVCKVIKPLAA